MKTRKTKISLLVVAIAIGIAMSSFTLGNYNEVTVKKDTSTLTNWEEYDKVSTYVYDKICTPISTAKGKKVKMESFSRCPSGYEPAIAGSSDSVKTNKFVYGKINLYKGCSPKHVCDFKVNVDKGIAQVKSKGTSQYMTVKEWLALPEPTPVQPQTKQKTSTAVNG